VNTARGRSGGGLVGSVRNNCSLAHRHRIANRPLACRRDGERPPRSWAATTPATITAITDTASRTLQSVPVPGVARKPASRPGSNEFASGRLAALPASHANWTNVLGTNSTSAAVASHVRRRSTRTANRCRRWPSAVERRSDGAHTRKRSARAPTLIIIVTYASQRGMARSSGESENIGWGCVTRMGEFWPALTTNAEATAACSAPARAVRPTTV
jgi:hypothetical protein